MSSGCAAITRSRTTRSSTSRKVRARFGLAAGQQPCSQHAVSGDWHRPEARRPGRNQSLEQAVALLASERNHQRLMPRPDEVMVALHKSRRLPAARSPQYARVPGEAG